MTISNHINDLIQMGIISEQPTNIVYDHSAGRSFHSFADFFFFFPLYFRHSDSNENFVSPFWPTYLEKSSI